MHGDMFNSFHAYSLESCQWLIIDNTGYIQKCMDTHTHAHLYAPPRPHTHTQTHAVSMQNNHCVHTFRHNRVAKADDIYPIFQHIISKLSCQPSISQHHRHNGVFFTLENINTDTIRCVCVCVCRPLNSIVTVCHLKNESQRILVYQTVMSFR